VKNHKGKPVTARQYEVLFSTRDHPFPKAGEKVGRVCDPPLNRSVQKTRASRLFGTVGATLRREVSPTTIIAA
jgi:hypothetical protein